MGRAKRYLLLRNNAQSGPYSYNELRKLSIRPSDLIWIEGESTSWPQPRFGSSGRAAAKRGRTQPAAGAPLPAYSGQQSAHTEPASHPASASFAAHPFYGPSQPGDSGFIQRERPAEDEDIELIFHSPDSHTVSLSQLLFIAMVTAACITVWNNRFQFIPETDQNVTYARAAEIVRFAPPTRPAATAAIVDVRDSGKMATAAIAPIGSPVKKSKKELPLRNPLTKKVNKAVSKDTLLVTLPVVIEKKDDVPPDTITAPAPATATPQPEEKKKTLGQALKNIFKKKKKNDGIPPDEQ